MFNSQAPVTIVVPAISQICDYMHACAFPAACICMHSRVQCLLHVLTLCCFVLQNRTSASAPLPNNQQVYNAYGAYQMLQAAPGQIITLTWPRTADPDGTVADGSSQLNIYYNPNATINAGV